MNSKRKEHRLTWEIITWIIIIIATILTVAFLPWYLATEALQYILALLVAAVVFWYLRSRHLFLESQQKSAQILAEQKELKIRQKTIDLIFDNSADGILILDNERKIISFSPGMEKITGYSKDEAINKDALSLLKFKPRHNESLLTDVVFLPKDVKREPLIRNTITNKEGRTIDIEASYTLITEGNGKHKALAILRDVTYENELMERDKEFIAITSHQMNTPLSIIRGYTSLLLVGKAGVLTKSQKAYLEEIYRAITKLITITNNLLSISRIEQDKIKLEITDVNVADMFKKIENNADFESKHAGVKIIFHEVDPKIIISADEEKLTQALMNFIGNSLKYTEKGSIEVGFKKNASMAQIMIKDTGIGISEDEINKIGEKFYRSQNAIDVDNQGTGLGFFIAKTIIEKHHGSINIKSELKKGTEITIDLPIEV
ncbi:MAG TPA: PAS domain-containing sensor histidine kinase [bacterium]|nr:PAS domain-containing sensor histidine kinase [bacterium]